MGLLPEHDLTNTLWYEGTFDLIGTLSGKTEHFDCASYAFTYIDTTTNLVELIHIDMNPIDVIARKFENTWLAQYPRPAQAQVAHENRDKFAG